MNRVENAAAVIGGRAWSFLVAGDERQFQGNDGYEDVVEESYGYDSTVGNHQQVAEGDLVVVRNGREALGIGYIEELEVFPDRPKDRRRCPVCRSTSFKERTRELPRYKCSPCQTAFDHPRVESIRVTEYRAHYGGTWQPLEGCLGKAQLSELSLSNSAQQSIRAMDRGRTMAAVVSRGVRLPDREGRRHRPFVLPGGHTRADVAVRRGQDAFRRALIRRYGLICAMTGPAPAEVLEAAHLRPFSETARHRVEEGLLLRSDIHRLFDSGLLAIRPDDLVIHVAPSLAGYHSYPDLNGLPLRVPEGVGLDRDVIGSHYSATIATW
ncbi:HNH endonuclease signature motif containing protein [Streptomyces sp. NPDC002039]|uniref:HNH endonuclease n=1 Tax=Streptomyces sp. NPDC002039 TaxID=3154660 RepID=UPI00332DC927